MTDLSLEGVFDLLDRVVDGLPETMDELMSRRRPVRVVQLEIACLAFLALAVWSAKELLS